MISACGNEPEQGDSAAEAMQSVTFRLDYVFSGYQAPLFLAAEKGYWRDRGLNVSLLESTGSADSVKAVVSGSDAMAFADRTTMLLAAAKGAEVTSVAGIGNRSGLAVATRPSAEVSTPQDLKGLSVLTTLGGNDGALLPAFLHSAGIPEGGVEVQGVAPDAKVSLLLNGKADGMTTVVYSSGAVAAAKIDLDFLLWSDHGFNTVSYGLVARADADKSLVESLVAGALRGFEYARKNVDETLDVYLREHPKENPEVARNQLTGFMDLMESPNTEGHPIGYQAPEDWAQTVAALTESELLEPGVDASAYFTNSFVLTS